MATGWPDSIFKVENTEIPSFAVMNRLRLDTAVAVDDHFRQAGFLVLPSPA